MWLYYHARMLPMWIPLAAATVSLPAVGALRVPGPLSPRNASYRLEASLDAEKKVVTGRERLSWRNLASQPARDLVFHLYMNAFKNEASTFFRESKGKHRSSHFESHGWGDIEVTRITVGGVDVTKRFVVDDTLGRVATGSGGDRSAGRDQPDGGHRDRLSHQAAAGVRSHWLQGRLLRGRPMVPQDRRLRL
jgi:hypothetical protein